MTHTFALNDAVASNAFREARQPTLALIEGIADSDLERVHSRLMSPLARDIAHIATFEDGQTLCLARIPSHSLMGRQPHGRPQAGDPDSAVCASGLELLTVPMGECLIGAGPGGFAYDNERPRSIIALPAFEIGRLHES